MHIWQDILQHNATSAIILSVLAKSKVQLEDDDPVCFLYVQIYTHSEQLPFIALVASSKYGAQ